MKNFKSPPERKTGKSKSLKSTEFASAVSTRGLSEMIDLNLVEFAAHSFKATDDITLLAQKIAIEVSFSLADKMDELNVLHQDFRAGLQRVIRFTLTSLFSRKEKCLVVPDAVPGFTLMGFKKLTASKELYPSEKEMIDLLKNNQPSNAPEVSAVGMIIESFYKSDEDKVLVIECSDAIFALFPVGDLKANLKMLGFYFVD